MFKTTLRTTLFVTRKEQSIAPHWDDFQLQWKKYYHFTNDDRSRFILYEYVLNRSEFTYWACAYQSKLKMVSFIKAVAVYHWLDGQRSKQHSSITVMLCTCALKIEQICVLTKEIRWGSAELDQVMNKKKKPVLQYLTSLIENQSK